MLFSTDWEMKQYLSSGPAMEQVGISIIWLHIKQDLMQQLVSLSISKETTPSILWLIFIIYATVQSFFAACMTDWNKTDKQKCPCVCFHICIKSFSFLGVDTEFDSLKIMNTEKKRIKQINSNWDVLQGYLIHLLNFFFFFLWDIQSFRSVNICPNAVNL